MDVDNIVTSKKMNISYDMNRFNEIKSESTKAFTIMEEPNSIQHPTGPKKRGINRDTHLEGECVTNGCSNIFNYSFRDIVKKGRLCRCCRVKIGNTKREETVSSIYGPDITSISQLESTKKKSKDTYKAKTGFDHPSQNPEVKQQLVNASIDKYGVPNPNMSNAIKQQKREKLVELGTLKYNNEFLDKLLLKNEAILEEKIDDFLLTRKSVILFKCKCGKEKEKNIRLIEKYGAFCDDCQLEHEKMKTIQTNMDVRGVPFVSQDPTVVAKARATNMKRYGVTSSMKRPEIKHKAIETSLKRHGVKFPQQNSEIRAKTIATLMKIHGVAHPMHNIDIAERASHNAYKAKDYSLPSGKIVRVQGYEHHALDILININKINEEDIILSRKFVPDIWYKDDNGCDRRYYMDIFIKSQNRCIEVKSTWTYEKNIKKVELTKKAVESKGINYECWIMNNKGAILS